MDEIELVAGLGISISQRGNNVEISADVVLSEMDKLFYKIQRLTDTVDTLLDRVSELEKINAKHEQFPSLKEAYDNYKMIERLCDEQDSQK